MIVVNQIKFIINSLDYLVCRTSDGLWQDTYISLVNKNKSVLRRGQDSVRMLALKLVFAILRSLFLQKLNRDYYKTICVNIVSDSSHSSNIFYPI